MGGWEGFLWLNYKSQKCSNADFVGINRNPRTLLTLDVAIRPKVVKWFLKKLIGSGIQTKHFYEECRAREKFLDAFWAPIIIGSPRDTKTYFRGGDCFFKHVL